VTVREWIEQRPAQPPASLTRQVLSMLGAEADAEESRTAEACLSAAARALDALVEEKRFARDHAAELLAIDALATYAFEHASLRGDPRQLAAFSEQGARVFGQLMAQRV
jgi:hypothetical protein